MSQAFAALQRLLPQHALSRGIGKLAQSEVPWIRRAFIHAFARAYNISLHEAVDNDLDDYRSFNDFFTRALRRDARPIAAEPNAIVCPADGTVSQAGQIVEGKLLQANGRTYSLSSLLGESQPQFNGGTVVTVYLAPLNYPRVHLPVDGTLLRTTAIPGELFSVNGLTEASVESLFARNERLVCHFQTEHGAMLVVLVGALIVASIETVWEGPSSPYSQLTHTRHNVAYRRGEEIGRFLLGSTVIVCFEPGRSELAERIVSGGPEVFMGQSLGRLH